MSEFFFILKSLFLTGVILLLFQIKVGSATIGQRTHRLIERSAIVAPVQVMADSITLLITQQGAWSSERFLKSLSVAAQKTKSASEDAWKSVKGSVGAHVGELSGDKESNQSKPEETVHPEQGAD